MPQSFTKVLQRLQSQDPKLKEIDLSNKSIDDDQLQELAAALRDNTIVIALDLYANYITYSGMEFLAEAFLRGNIILTTLDLGGNEIDCTAIECLVKSLPTMTSLTTLLLSNNQIEYRDWDKKTDLKT